MNMYEGNFTTTMTKYNIFENYFQGQRLTLWNIYRFENYIINRFSNPRTADPIASWTQHTEQYYYKYCDTGVQFIL